MSKTKFDFSNIDVTKMNWQTWFFIITITLATTIASYYGVQVQVSWQFEAKIIDLARDLNMTREMLEQVLNSSWYGLQKPYSYLITKVSSYFCLQNGTTGKLDDYDANATEIIQPALDVVSSIGGSILLKEGEFIVDGLKVTTSKTVIIEGIGQNFYEGQGATVIKLRDHATGGAISSQYPSFAERAIILMDGTSSGSITIRNLRINGNRYNQDYNITGIVIRSCKGYLIEDNVIEYACRFGIANYDNTGYILRNKVYMINNAGETNETIARPDEPIEENLVGIYSAETDVTIQDNMIGWIGREHGVSQGQERGRMGHLGVCITCGTSNTVSRNWMWSAAEGIHAIGGDASITDNFIEAVKSIGIVVEGDNNIVTGNRIRLGATKDSSDWDNPFAGIYLGEATPTFNQITNNIIYSRGSSYGAYDYGIYEGSGGNNNYIIDNALLMTVRAGITDAIYWTGSGTVVFNNAGYQNNIVPANALVFKEGSLIKAMDQYGNLKKEGTDPDVVINWATLNLLTAGRTQKERIIVIGDFTGLDHGINVYNYTIFELVGSLQIASDLCLTTHPDVLHQAYGNDIEGHDIEIIGGTYDGNRHNNNSLIIGSGYWNWEALNCLYFTNTTNLIVRNAVLKDAGTVGLHIDSCRNVLVENVKIYDPYFHGCHPGHNSPDDPVANLTFTNCYIEGPRSRPSPSQDREADGGAIVGGCDLGYFILRDSIINYSYAQSVSGGVYTEIVNNIIYNVGSYGISVGGVRAIIQGNTIYHSGLLEFAPNSNITNRAGIRSEADFATISGNIVMTNASEAIYVVAGVATIEGNEVTGNCSYGIYVTNSIRVTISNNFVDIAGNARTGIYAKVAHSTIIGNSVQGNLSTGISIASNSWNSTIIGNSVTSDLAISNTAGIVCQGENSVVSGNVVQSFDRSMGIYNSGGSGSFITGNSFKGAKYWLYVTQSGTENLTITNNILEGSYHPSSPQGDGFIIKYNIGFVTENSGTATIDSSTSVQFDHGLAGTPTLVLCSFNVTGWASWKWSATSTQITITVETSGTYEVYWYASYEP